MDNVRVLENVRLGFELSPSEPPEKRIKNIIKGRLYHYERNNNDVLYKAIKKRIARFSEKIARIFA